jgi:pimeloyl-ACP methyl ester carboxylesterase
LSKRETNQNNYLYRRRSIGFFYPNRVEYKYKFLCVSASFSPADIEGMFLLTRLYSRTIDLNGLDTHYLTLGKGDPLIILHGGSSGAQAWKKNIEMLSQKYTIYVPDLPGFGLSEPLEGSYYIAEMVNFVENFARALGLKLFYLMGHSFGGGLALHYTLKNPTHIRKLVLVSSLCLGKEIAWWVRVCSSPFFCVSLGRVIMGIFKGIKRIARFFGPWEIAEPITRTSIHIGSRISNITQQTVVLLSQLPQIVAPTLVVWGEKDPIVPFAHAYSAGGLIPDCRVKVFEDCGHSVYRDRLDDFSTELKRFLD